MRISRDKYLNDLVARKGNGMVKVVTGARRCGKTYLLFDLFEDHLRAQGVDDDHIIEIALDDLMYERYRDPLALYDYVRSRITNREEPDPVHMQSLIALYRYTKVEADMHICFDLSQFITMVNFSATLHSTRQRQNPATQTPPRSGSPLYDSVHGT